MEERKKKNKVKMHRYIPLLLSLATTVRTVLNCHQCIVYPTINAHNIINIGK